MSQILTSGRIETHHDIHNIEILRIARHRDTCLYSHLVGRLRQEDRLSLGVQGYGALRSCF
uniref:Macaca fascicularis brain cDNA clone: QtrA-16975, similar to human hypothetical protein FLJ35382 (FLJ35382), mRNA, RefSeq: NM_152608.2 n=1 Tax=Macaca fascicularis TaxID=9541 RepID=I7G9J5_MACFA|nr:unnamed protein product [Macaca fascicularis]